MSVMFVLGIVLIGFAVFGIAAFTAALQKQDERVYRQHLQALHVDAEREGR